MIPHDPEYLDRIRHKVDGGRFLTLYEAEVLVAENRALHDEVSALTAELVKGAEPAAELLAMARRFSDLIEQRDRARDLAAAFEDAAADPDYEVNRAFRQVAP